MLSDDEFQPAAIEYMGHAGSTAECKEAVVRLLQAREEITRVRILTCDHQHCLLLTIGEYDLVAIKSGFASGYTGAGAHGFSFVLQLLEAYLPSDRKTNNGAELIINEYEVGKEIIERIDNSALTRKDVEAVNSIRSVRPLRWYGYILESHRKAKEDGTLFQKIRPILPLGIVDPRILDLALSFWDDPNSRILKAFSRLEELIRKRTAIKEVGAKLFQEAFDIERGKLGWKNLERSEQVGRIQLFAGAYMVHRNPRAHKDIEKEAEENQVSEFLLVNHLFRLEKEAKSRRGNRRRDQKS